MIELASKRKQPAWTREVHPPYWTLLLERDFRLDYDCDCNQRFVNHSFSFLAVEIDTVAHSTLRMGTYKENVLECVPAFSMKKISFRSNDVFRSVRANGNLCFLNQEPSSSFRKAKKEKRNPSRWHVRFTFCYINCFVQRSLPPCKTTTTNAQIQRELGDMTVNFLLKQLWRRKMLNRISHTSPI